MRRLRLPHGVIKRYRRFPRVMRPHLPNGNARKYAWGGTEGFRRRRRRPEADRRTANHVGGCGCSQKRKRKSGPVLPGGNYWSRDENDADNAWILNSNGTELNDNNGNDHKENGSNAVVCVVRVTRKRPRPFPYWYKNRLETLTAEYPASAGTKKERSGPKCLWYSILRNR